jgi:hypothetical protein
MYRLRIEPGCQPNTYRVHVRETLIGVIGITDGQYWASTTYGVSLVNQDSFERCQEWLFDAHVCGV